MSPEQVVETLQDVLDETDHGAVFQPEPAHIAAFVAAANRFGIGTFHPVEPAEDDNLAFGPETSDDFLRIIINPQDVVDVTVAGETDCWTPELAEKFRFLAAALNLASTQS